MIRFIIKLLSIQLLFVYALFKEYKKRFFTFNEEVL
jgi:hypothetical protein